MTIVKPKATRRLPIWQITLPLGAVLIFGIGAFTAFSMVEGRYLFDLDINREGIKIRTDVDKREDSSLQDRAEESDTPGESLRERIPDPSIDPK